MTGHKTRYGASARVEAYLLDAGRCRRLVPSNEAIAHECQADESTVRKVIAEWDDVGQLILVPAGRMRRVVAWCEVNP
jgi:hypothetical protein